MSTRDYTSHLRRFHEAKWDEELVYELSTPGQRGVLPPLADPQIVAAVGDGVSQIPVTLRRQQAPNLPEVSQPRLNRHYLRLSQETLGVDVTPDLSQGTCTMKYSPKVQEHLVATNPNVVEMHPLQPASSMQGLLEIHCQMEQFLKEISGLDAFTFQPGGGAHACFTGACVVRAYHQEHGQAQRDEIITTMFSHPCDAGCPATAGYKVITLMPDENGYPDLAALKAALSERTAALFITNPEDTGIFNPRIKEYVDAAHAVGALCYYDQANANGILGITRAKEAGFDMIHYNVHKTFSSPHGGMGPGCGALGVAEFLRPYLPTPLVERSGDQYVLNYDLPHSIGRIRSFMGNLPIVVRGYMWIMQHGADGLHEVAVCSVLNNQYLMKKIAQIPGVVIKYAAGKRRLEQVRYSWEKLQEDTGFGTVDVSLRLIDFGMEHYWQSHHPWVVPEPFTLEPTESFSRDDLDEYAAVLAEVARECYEEPEKVATAPHNAPIHRTREFDLDDFDKIAVTWRQLQKKKAHIFK